MSVATKVIVEGTVVDVTSRSGVSKQTGEVWERRTVLVFGDNGTGVVAEIGIRDAKLGVPEIGTKVRALCEVGVYRDDDNLDLIRYVK